MPRKIRTYWLAKLSFWISAMLILFSGSSLHSQNSILKSEKSWTGNVHGGFVIPHHPEMRSLVTGHAKSFELSLELSTDVSKEWYKAYQKPSLALDFFAASLGNPEQLGEQYHLLLGPILPLNPGKKISIRLQLGMGPGIASKIWDLETNYQATPISSRLAAALVAQLGVKIPITESVALNAGARMSHLSNAAFKMPNLGTNLASIYLGVRFGKTPSQFPIEQLSTDPIKFSARTLSASLALGLREIMPPGGKKYQMWTANIGHDWRRTYKSAFGLYADVMYNTNLTPLLSESRDKQVTNADNLRIGLAGAYTIHFEQWRIKFMFGGYLKNEFKQDGWIYNRVALRYHFPKGVFASLGMKTHLSVADHWEWGLGYIIRQK